MLYACVASWPGTITLSGGLVCIPMFSVGSSRAGPILTRDFRCLQFEQASVILFLLNGLLSPV